MIKFICPNCGFRYGFQTERLQKEAIAKETYETCYKPFLQEGQIPIFETR